MGRGGADHAKESIACDQGGCQTNGTEGNSSVAKACYHFGVTEQARYARCERPAICSHGERRCCTPLFHQRESTRVFGGISADGKCHVITAVFAFGTDALAEPPNCRMIKKKRFGHDLEEIEEGIKRADMCEFMRDHGAQLKFCKSTQGADRKKQNGTKPADNGRCVEMERFTIADGAGDAEPVLHFAAQCEQARIHQFGFAATQTRDDEEPAGGAQTKKHDADEPEFDKDSKQAAGKKARLGAGDHAVSCKVNNVSDRWDGGLRRSAECGFALVKQEIRDNRRGDHQDKCAYRNGITSGRLASRCDQGGCKHREGRPLPQEVEQRESECSQDVWRKPVGNGSHRIVLSYSSSKRRSSSISFLELRRPASACSISSFAEPSKTRCRTSEANWRLVFSAGCSAS